LDDPDFANGIYTLFTDQGLYAIEDVTSLPPAGTFVGEKVFNRTDGKLYQWTGSAWDLVVADVADGSITSTKIDDNAVTTPKISAGSITGDKIVANTITGGLLSTSGIITNSAQINDAVVTNAKISNAAITSAKIGTAEIKTANIENGAVTNRFAAFTAGNLSLTTSYKMAQSVTIDADGNPVSVTFNVGVSGSISVILDVRVDGVSQRTFNVSSGYFLSGPSSQASFFIGSVPNFTSINPIVTFTNVSFYEQMETVSLVVSPASGSRSVQVYARMSSGSGGVLRNRFLETTELKR
jgi:hypothetical protein